MSVRDHQYDQSDHDECDRPVSLNPKRPKGPKRPERPKRPNRFQSNMANPYQKDNEKPKSQANKSHNKVERPRAYLIWKRR